LLFLLSLLMRCSTKLSKRSEKFCNKFIVCAWMGKLVSSDDCCIVEIVGGGRTVDDLDLESFGKLTGDIIGGATADRVR